MDRFGGLAAFHLSSFLGVGPHRTWDGCGESWDGVHQSSQFIAATKTQTPVLANLQVPVNPFEALTLLTLASWDSNKFFNVD